MMDVATAMSSATLVEFCCNACLAHRLVMWLAHFVVLCKALGKSRCKHQKNQHGGVASLSSYLNGVVFFPRFLC